MVSSAISSIPPYFLRMSSFLPSSNKSETSSNLKASDVILGFSIGQLILSLSNLILIFLSNKTSTLFSYIYPLTTLLLIRYLIVNLWSLLQDDLPLLLQYNSMSLLSISVFWEYIIPAKLFFISVKTLPPEVMNNSYKPSISVLYVLINFGFKASLGILLFLYIAKNSDK